MTKKWKSEKGRQKRKSEKGRQKRKSVKMENLLVNVRCHISSRRHQHNNIIWINNFQSFQIGSNLNKLD